MEKQRVKKSSRGLATEMRTLRCHPLIDRRTEQGREENIRAIWININGKVLTENKEREKRVAYVIIFITFCCFFCCYVDHFCSPNVNIFLGWTLSSQKRSCVPTVCLHPSCSRSCLRHVRQVLSSLLKECYIRRRRLTLRAQKLKNYIRENLIMQSHHVLHLLENIKATHKKTASGD